MPSTTYTDVTFGARAIGARTTAAAAAATDLSAEEDRYTAAVYGEGFFAADDFEPVSGGAATWDVTVGSGSAKTDIYVVPGTDAGQGNYLVRLAASTEDVTIDPADGSNPRTDEIYLIVADQAYDAGSIALPRFGYRKGDPSGTPADPGPDSGWKAYALLASVAVPAGAADIEECTITDERGGATFLGKDLHGTALPEDIGIVPLAGSSVKLARADHEHDLGNAWYNGVQGGAAQTILTPAFSAAWTDYIQDGFVFPTGWGSALMTVEATVSAIATATGDVHQLQVGATGDFGPTASDGGNFPAVNSRHSLSASHEFTVTATTTLRAQTRETGATAGGGLVGGIMRWTAIRLA